MTTAHLNGDMEVRAEISYVTNSPTRADEPLEFVTEDESRSTMETFPGRVVAIRDARPLATTLDREGFRLARHSSTVANFGLIEEDPGTDQLYVTEMTQLLQEVTGAEFVLLLGGAKKRFGEAAKAELSGLANAKPARYPHADNTDSSADVLFGLIRTHLGDKVPTGRRWAMYNMWRAVSPPPQDIPLAICDATSVAASDEITVTAVTTTRDSGDLRHDTTGYKYNPSHRWHYYPDMTVDEVIVFKAHDSDPAHSSRVPHSAFNHPGCPPGTPTRASVEARGLVIFG